MSLHDVTMPSSASLLRTFGIKGAGHPWLRRALRLRRRLLRYDERLANQYLTAATEPKLHIGGGWHTLEGWLNTDLEALPEVVIMDATTRFRFADESFEFVFSEHMIEHVPYEDGSKMLFECYRVMRKGGVIRITTPDLAAISGLYQAPLSDLQQRYMSWFCETFLPADRPCSSTFVINAHFRMWGHQFVYDQQTLADAMERAGFTSVARKRLGVSDHRALRNLENVQRYPDGLLDFESVALEGRK